MADGSGVLAPVSVGVAAPNGGGVAQAPALRPRVARSAASRARRRSIEPSLGARSKLTVVEDLAGVRAVLRRSDNAALLELVDQSRGARVSDP